MRNYQGICATKVCKRNYNLRKECAKPRPYPYPIWIKTDQTRPVAKPLLRGPKKLEQRGHSNKPSPANSNAIYLSPIDEFVELGLSKSDCATGLGDRACRPLRKGNGRTGELPGCARGRANFGSHATSFLVRFLLPSIPNQLRLFAVPAVKHRRRYRFGKARIVDLDAEIVARIFVFGPLRPRRS